MNIALWPEAKVAAWLRLGSLVVILILVVIGCMALRQSGEAGNVFLRSTLTLVGARTIEALASLPPSTKYEGTQLNGIYALSLAKQIWVAQKCGQFFMEKGFAPKNLGDLAKYGVTLADQQDPWDRPLKIRMVTRNQIIVQSTGPSGIDRVSDELLSTLVDSGTRRYVLIGDNLIVLRQLP